MTNTCIHQAVITFLFEPGFISMNSFLHAAGIEEAGTVQGRGLSLAGHKVLKASSLVDRECMHQQEILHSDHG